MKTLEPAAVPEEELEQLDGVVKSLPVDSPLRSGLAEVSEAVHSGVVVVINGDRTLTPSEAARLLGMSRTHLYKILDANELPWKQVGRDRRIAKSDLVKFIKSWDQAHKEMAERLANPARTRDTARKALFG